MRSNYSASIEKWCHSLPTSPLCCRVMWVCVSDTCRRSPTCPFCLPYWCRCRSNSTLLLKTPCPHVFPRLAQLKYCRFCHRRVFGRLSCTIYSDSVCLHMTLWGLQRCVVWTHIDASRRLVRHLPIDARVAPFERDASARCADGSLWD